MSKLNTTKPDSKADEKEFVMVVPKSVSSKPHVMAALRGKKKGGVVRMNLFERFDVTGSSNTAYSTVAALKPKDANDWTSVAALFDVGRCVGITVQSRFAVVNGTANSGTMAVWSYDPGTAVAITSVLDGLSHEYNSGVVSMGNNYGSSIPNSSTATGMLPKWRAKCAPNFESGLTSDLVGSNWFPLTSSVNAIIGYLCPYIEAGGTSVTIATYTYVTYHMEFKFRH